MRSRLLEPDAEPRPPRNARGLTNWQMKLVPVEKGDKVKGGRKSRRIRKFKWVPA
jgi:hypothetical protein